MDFQKLEATAVIRKNSIAFIENVFALNDARRPFVMVNDAKEASGLSGIVIDRCITPAEQSGWYTARHPLIHDDLPAQVSYTSGTEGQPKGVLLTYANLADAAERIIAEMQMTAEIREYVGVPATFSFGMGRYRAISAVGGHAYLPPRGFDPLELARMLAANQVNALSAVPTLLRILLDAPDLIGEAGKNLRWMEIGSQHMTADEKLRVRTMFPNALIVQHYGLTEASRSTFLQVSSASESQLHSVGRPVGRTEIQLGADCRIRIRGPHVARWRIDAKGLHNLQDADGWLQTNDLGHMRDGCLFFDGRADDLINCGGVKVSPDLLEERIRSGLEPGMQIAVAKVPDAQRGDGVLVAVKAGPSGTARVKELAAAALQSMGVVAGSALHVMAVDALPVTGTGKVKRSVLAEQFVSQLTPDRSHVPTGEISDVLSLFRHEFPGQPVRPEDSFESLGGDSLHYIQFSLSFEQRFGQLPNNWPQLSAAELQQGLGTTKKSNWRRLESATLTRAFFMICIVALHTDAFVYSSNWGAAYFLILLAGYSVARFQLPEIIRTGSTRTLWGTIKYVAIPTLLMVAFLQGATQRFEILPLLLVSNYLDPRELKGFIFYFSEFYLQLLVLAAAFFSFSKVQDSFKSRPMLSALVLLLAVAALNQIIEFFWDSTYNYHRTPWNYAWAFALGIVLALAKDPSKRLLALFVAIAAVLLKWGATSAAFYVAGGCALVLFVEAFIVPIPIKVLVAEIAGASLFIYLTHYVMISVVRKIFGVEKPWMALISSVIVGVALAHLYAWTSRKLVRTIDELRGGSGTTALPRSSP
ncbi:AMP-binding protein [Paracoccus litorisediminis]|uniref:AMP-binding protein n=1 Tax=Paracoccus litorisediminis TaxID=2006130 RepID=A0A844HS06_9RHOB|nr:AMP-binding protein [Paracoccus litorisediminis]MTH60985.1 AMP-binding protein [Paracoccus litorisediminis]